MDMSAGWNLDDAERLFENEKRRACRDTSDCCILEELEVIESKGETKRSSTRQGRGSVILRRSYRRRWH